MIKVLVNADDYGFDENRTKAILDAYRMGLVTTTTAMVNMPWFERAVKMAKGTKLYENIGLHLNLTEGMPITKRIRKFSRFCNPEGTFNAVFHRGAWSRLCLSRGEQLAMAEEAEAQMEKYLSAQLPLMHLDSHHHSHTDFAVAKVILPIAKRLGFMSIRRSRDIGMKLTLGKFLYKGIVNRMMGHAVGFRTNHFGSVDDFERVRAELPRNAIVEVMVHPLFRERDHLSLNGVFYDGNYGTNLIVDRKRYFEAIKDMCRLCNYKEI